MSEDSKQNTPTQEMVNWLRLLGMKQLVETIKSVLNDPKKISVYQYSDGERTTREIESMTGLNKNSVSDLWEKCVLGGLGEYKTASGGRRFKKTFDLEALGLIQNQKKPGQSNSNNTEETISEQSTMEAESDD